MSVTVTGQRVEVTPALKDYTLKKFDKMKRYYDKVSNISVTVDVEKKRQIATANAHVAGVQLHASSEHENLYAAIDNLADKLEQQLKKHKAKLQDHRD